MDFEQLITERYSVRNFKPDRLPQEMVDRLLHAAHLAPTGCNFQPQRLLVLNSEQAMTKLRGCTKCHFGAPAAILVCHNRDESWKRPYDGALSSPVDAAIVATHLMLMAHDLGLGACWVMHFNPTAMREAFAIPENVEPVALLVLGYPSEDAKPIPMHFATRPLDEIVVYDTF